MTELLPTPGMGGHKLEEFLGDLLKRMERVPGADPRLVTSSRNGTSGQKQGGVDHRGRFSDGDRGAWSCKEQKSLTKADIGEIIKEMSDAGETVERRVIVYSRIASPEARSEIAKHAGWEIWDQVDLGDHVRSLLVQDARTLLDTYFDKAFRRRFLPISSTDVFLSMEDYFAPLLNVDDRFHHGAALVGRDKDVTTLVSALTNPSGLKVLIIEGPAGRGKSRLVFEVLKEVEEKLKPLPVLVRAEGHVLDAGALDELPLAPTVLLIEDVHRDLAGLAVLLQWVRRTDGVRVVLTTRTFARGACEGAVVAAHFALAEAMVHTVGPLGATAARQLVAALQGDDVALGASFAEGLAQAARATPFLALVAVAMIRRGEFSTALGLNNDLRREIMARYGEVTAGGADGIPAHQTRKLLATMAALSQVRLTDTPLIEAMAEFLGTKRGELLRTIQALIEHGVVLNRANTVSVVPDLLGEEMLAREAVVMGVDSGFVDQLWQAFPAEHLALLTSLASLDWRLQYTAELDGTVPADVLSACWDDFRARFLAADHAGRCAALEEMATVAATQSSRMLPLLLDAIANPGPDIPGAWLTHDDVRHRCARSAGICATSDTNLLGDTFDLLWDLARTAVGEPHREPNHPVRVVEELARLDADAALATADVLMDRVSVWLAQPANTDLHRSPLFAVEPLLAKSGSTPEWQLNAIAFRPFTVDPNAVRALRDRIRQLLAPVIVGAEVARAVEAVRLLGAALDEPIGYFGRQVPADTIRAWEDDDLRTVAVLADAAEATTEPLVRCEIRTAVSRHAEFAASTAVKQASSALLCAVEAHDEDLLTELLAHGDYQRVGLTEPEPNPDADVVGEPPLPAGDGQVTAITLYNETTERRNQARQRLAEQLWENDSAPGEMVGLIAERLAVIAAVQSEPAPGLEQVLRAVVDARPDETAALFRAINSGPESHLDYAVDVVLDVLLDQDQPGFLQALRTAVASRPSLAIGALRGFARSRWNAAAVDAAAIITDAIAHPDHAVRQAALSSAGALLRQNPVGISPLLRTSIPSYPNAADFAIVIAADRDPDGWVATMSDPERREVLSLLAALPTLSPLNRLVLKAIAAALPTDVIDVLAAKAESGGSQRLRPGWLLDRAFANHPDALTDWIKRAARSTGTQRFNWARIWPVIAGVPLTDAASTAISVFATDGTTDELHFLADSLMNCPGFVLDQPTLAAEILGSLSRHPRSIRDQVRSALRISGLPRGTSRTPGQPARQNVVNRDRAETLSTDVDLNEDVRQFYRELRTVLQADIDRDLAADQAEADN